MKAKLPPLFQKLSAASPAAAGKAAHFLFTHPLPTAIRSEAEKRLARKAQAKLTEAERTDMWVNGYRIASYRFAAATPKPRGTVMMVHGWTSASAFMTAPIPALCERGYDVVAFDMPAHGKSSGRRAELMDCVLAMIAVADRHGPIDQIIAHSFGGPVTTMTIAGGLSKGLTDQTRLLFIASPNRLADVTEQFSRAIGLSREAQAEFEKRLVQPFGVDLDAMDGNLLLSDCPNPLTILHSRDDREVAFDAAEKFASLGEQVTLRPLNGLGHRRILHAQPSVAAMLDAVSG
ncbi:alpha/beta hydrolase [Aurantiacibacter sediminis]|uniref:Alpha/beta fold hydrolase n=1 Tax=Aurantiacibacter sediminis TaxID=2793064 RepID=A0ABS0N5C0_9SPHN|nr:alpha/beta fold hydrolase [Aurantiacibacter sediminis]MBH5322978.1 alpha/beta fold hydrolase [Aurantiacibacter sediminis]